MLKKRKVFTKLFLVFTALLLVVLNGFSSATNIYLYKNEDNPLESTGFFRVEKIDDTWWFITPNGEKFYSFAVSGINQPVFCYDVESNFVNLTTQRLKEWNINTIMGNTDPFSDFSWIVRFRWKHLSILHDKGWKHERFPDVFDPWWQNEVNQSAIKYASFLKNDTSLIGYFTDNEMKWGPDTSDQLNLLDVYIAADWYTAGKKEAVNFLKDRYDNDIKSFNEVWNMKILNFDELMNISQLGLKNSWRLRSRFKADVKSIINDYENLSNNKFFSKAKQDIIDFSEYVAEKYFNITDNALKKADPNHLNLGVRFHLLGVPEEVLKICGKYIDVVSINYYRNYIRIYDPDWTFYSNKYCCVPLNNFMKKYSDIPDKPIFIAEYTYQIFDGSTPIKLNEISPSSKGFSQEERYNIYEWYASNCFKSKYVIGLAWFVFEDGYGAYGGLVTKWNEPYTIFNKKMGELNSKAIKMHENSTDKINDFFPFYRNICKLERISYTFTKILGFISMSQKIQDIFDFNNYDKRIERNVVENLNNIDYDILVDIKGNGDYDSIQEAINNSKSGDKIFVNKGVYKEKIIIEKSLVLIGSSSSNTTISGFYDDNIFTNDPVENNFVITINANNVTIKSFNITSHGTFNDSSGNFRACPGIKIFNQKNIEISNNIFYKLGGYDGGGGILGQKTSDLLIKNNTFNKISGIALIIDETTNSIIKNNNFINNSLYAIWVSQAKNITVFNNIIEGSEFGVVLTKTKNTIIENNLFQNNKQKCFILKNSTENKIINNSFTKTHFNILNNKLTCAEFFYTKGNFWESNYWFKPRSTPIKIYGKIGTENFRLTYEKDLNPASKIIFKP